MNSKSKKKKNRALSTQKPQKKDNFIHLFDLKSLCSSNIIDVIFFVGNNERSNSVLNNIKSISKKYEEVTCATIITEEDVLELLEEPTLSLNLPEPMGGQLESCLENIKTYLKAGQSLPTSMKAELLKIKLISLLCQQNTSRRDRQLRMKQFEEKLNMLTKECKPIHPLINEKSARSTSRMEILENNTLKSKVSKLNVLGEFRKTKSKSDLTDFLFQDDFLEDIVFDDDISKHISYYIFLGMNDSQLLTYVIENMNVPVTAIVKISLLSSDASENETDNFKIFWTNTYDYLYGPCRRESFENTFLMKYDSLKELDYEHVYRDLIEMLRNMWCIKLRHLNYIRHNKLAFMRDNYSIIPADCYDQYEKSLQTLPGELIGAHVVLGGILQQFTKKSIANNIFLNKIFSNEQTFKTNSSFLIYEDNTLELITKSYGKLIGNLISSLSLVIWKQSYPFTSRNNISIADDILHKHDRDPDSSTSCPETEKILQFMYIFLFGLFKEDDTIPNDPSVEEFAKDLYMHSNMKFWQQCQVRIDEESENEITEIHNFYKPPLSSFVWKEKLSSDVLIQKVMKAYNQYQYIQRKYCPETNKYLLLFSDHLDEFGVNVKVFDDFLHTPICLRDFCKFITNKESDWLLKNQPPKYYREADKHPIGKILKEEDEIYRRLLSLKINNGENVLEDVEEEGEHTITFEDLFKELKYYPSNKALEQECDKIINEAAINSYDLGKKFFSIMGSQTTFVSHDGVKLIVDNTKFIDEKPKCSVQLICEKNRLVLYSDPFFIKNCYYFQVEVENGTIITFYIKEKHKSENNFNSNNTSEMMTKTTSIPSLSNEMISNLNNLTITQINQNDLTEQIEQLSTSGLSNITLETIVNKLENGNNIGLHKIRNNLKFISPSVPNLQIPLINLIYQLATKKRENNIGYPLSFLKRYTVAASKEIESTEPVMDFRITLPNGLYLSCVHCSHTDESLLCDVKQEFLKYNDETDEIFVEEYRLFTRNNFILVKKLDGTIVIYKSSGDQIIYEKPDGAEEILRDSNLKRCHRMNKTVYKKQLWNLINKRYGKERTASSRKDNNETKKGYVINEVVLNMLNNFNIPYKKSTIINFTGHKICLENNKITQKHKYFLIPEYDPSSEEVFYERTDGFKSLLDKVGRHSVKFSDGTLITTWPHIKDELVDGFIFVSLIVQYEHPKYVTVVYEWDETLRVQLKDDVILTKHQKNKAYELKIGQKIETNIDMKSVLFGRLCENCNGEFKCDFNIEPFIIKNREMDDNFVYARDSYNKKFFVDFTGKCWRNNNFVKTMTNTDSCNHVINNTYRKMFIFDENCCGEQLWSENMVENEKRKEKLTGEIKEVIGVNGKKVLRIRKPYFQFFDRRFLNESLDDSMLLTKYKEQTPKNSAKFYTYRILQKMIDTEEVQELFGDLRSFLQKQKMTLHLLENSADNLLQKDEILITSEVSQKKSQDEISKKCKCKVIKKTMKDKIFKWREELKKCKNILHAELPTYFNSEFCNIKS